MYRINWEVYRTFVGNLTTTEHRDVVHEMVKNYLYTNQDDFVNSACVRELVHIGILQHTEIPTEERRNIVQPFNFMGNGTQNS
jgi:hypothetical protein